MRGLVLSLFLTSYLASVYGRPGFAHDGGDLGSYGGGADENNGGYAQIQLVGVPDIHGYSGFHYPQFDIQDLGTVYQGEVPPKIVKISSTVALKIPKPYPVKIPHNVPYPVHVDKPYPVPVTQIVKVPQPVPVEVIKSVPVPVEVPKPYPVPHNEYQSSHSGGLDSYGGSSSHNDYQQSQSDGVDGYGGSSVNNNYGVENQGSGGFVASSGYGNSYSNYNSQDSYGQGYQGQGDSSNNYATITKSDNYEVKQNEEEESS